MRAVLIALICAHVSFAHAGPANQSATERAQRREALPHIRAASDCVAREMLSEHSYEDAMKLLHLATTATLNYNGPVARCRFAINDMISAHDRIYGAGTGEKFFKGPYIDDLARAIRARSGKQG